MAKFDAMEGDLNALRYLDVVGLQAGHVHNKDVGVGYSLTSTGVEAIALVSRT